MSYIRASIDKSIFDEKLRYNDTLYTPKSIPFDILNTYCIVHSIDDNG